MSAETVEQITPTTVPDEPASVPSAQAEASATQPNPPAPEPEEGQVVPDPPRSETERIDPTSKNVTLSDGTEVEIEPLKLRQFLRFMRILTRGGQAVMGAVDWNMDMNGDEFAQQVMVMLLFAIPESEEETVQFVKSMVRPAGIVKARDVATQRANAEKDAALQKSLDNPELDDLLTILQAIVERESSDLVALGKRLKAMIKVAEKMGALKPSNSTDSSLAESPPAQI